MIPCARLVHPVPVTLELANNHNHLAPMQEPFLPSPPVTLPAQVTWCQHGDAGFHAHVPTSLYAGSLTFSAATINPLPPKKTLVQARVLSIARHDYTHATLLISHLVPLAHRGFAHLVKAFFSDEVVPLGRENVPLNLLNGQS